MAVDLHRPRHAKTPAEIAAMWPPKTDRLTSLWFCHGKHCAASNKMHYTHRPGSGIHRFVEGVQS